jgi:ACT domain-containing protein
MDATEMQDLLDLAAEKRARQIIETVKRIGLSRSEDVDTQFDDELEGL